MKRIRLKPILTLAIVLLISLTSCSTTKDIQVPETSISIPVISTPIAKPILENIPQMDSSTLTEIQQSQLALVLGAYNRNLLRLVGYAIRLGGYADASDAYIKSIEEAIKDL